MKRYLMTFMAFLVFIPVGYSQDTILTIIGEKVSASTDMPVQQPTLMVDTLVDVGFIDHTGKKVDTMFMVKIIDPIDSATYKVLEVIRGDLKKDTIHFIFHDKHHVASSNHVLLFLEKGDLGYILTRQPIEVYMTKDKRWASPYITEMEKYPRMPFQKTGFNPELVFDISMYDDEYIKKHYPSPYYKIKKDKAIAVQGIYAKELLTWVHSKHSVTMVLIEGISMSVLENRPSIEPFKQVRLRQENLSGDQTPEELLPP
jgi:hypothetical protein